MYYLNLTLTLNIHLKAETIEWIKGQFIPEIIKTIGFSSAKLIWVKTSTMAESISYAVQFETTTYAIIEKYHEKEPLIFQWINKKYGEDILPFSTELHLIESF